MNYYEHHIGDFDSATAHLSLLEDAVYSRLLRVYYRTEQPIPADVKQAARLVRAMTKQERDTVQAVLEEFFELRDDGWHNARCDAEIARFQDGEPEREVKKANEANRLKRHREERAALFQQLTAAGQHAPWNISINDLREMVKRLPATVPETQEPPLPATAPATPATATQTPDTKHQYPVEEISTRSGDSTVVARVPNQPSVDLSGQEPTAAGLVCRAMKAVRLQGVNPGDPRLLALIAQGATQEEFVGIAEEAVAKGKGFAWVLVAVQGRREEAQRIALAPRMAATATNRQEAVEQRNRAVGEEWLRQQENADAKG